MTRYEIEFSRENKNAVLSRMRNLSVRIVGGKKSIVIEATPIQAEDLRTRLKGYAKVASV